MKNVPWLVARVGIAMMAKLTSAAKAVGWGGVYGTAEAVPLRFLPQGDLVGVGLMKELCGCCLGGDSHDGQAYLSG
jgi:hypothetical protein